MSRQCKGCLRKACPAWPFVRGGLGGVSVPISWPDRSLALIVFGKPPVAAGHSRPPRGPSVPRPRPRPRPEASAAFPSTPSLRSRPAFPGSACAQVTCTRGRGDAACGSRPARAHANPPPLSPSTSCSPFLAPWCWRTLSRTGGVDSRRTPLISHPFQPLTPRKLAHAGEVLVHLARTPLSSSLLVQWEVCIAKCHYYCTSEHH